MFITRRGAGIRALSSCSAIARNRRAGSPPKAGSTRPTRSSPRSNGSCRATARSTAAAGAGRSSPQPLSQQDALAGIVPGPLPAAHAAGVGAVGVLLHHRLRLAGLDSDVVSRSLSPAAATGAQLRDLRPGRQPHRLADLRLPDRSHRPPPLVHRRILSHRGGPDLAMGNRRRHRASAC